jgi:uncharacterized OB-fold protein
MDEPGMVGDRPMPAIEPHTERFWKAARERQLLVPKCGDCQALQFPPETSCTHCGSPSQEWVAVSGRATLYTWTICHPPLLPYFARHAPWPVVCVELAEGVRMVSQIPDVRVEDYAIGMPLVADFEDVDEERTLVVFRPA